jgi:hypothetical protein
MKKGTIIAVSLAALAVIGIMILGRSINGAMSSQAEVTIKSDLTAPETLFDFGVISMKDGNVAHTFQVKNPTDKDLTVVRLSTSCMCTNAYIVDGASRSGPYGMPGMGGTKTNTVFKARKSKKIEIVFDPNAHGPAGVGPMQRFIHLTDASGGKLQLQITGTVKP